MLTKISADKFTLQGVSLGGVYTSIFAPELGTLFDLGIATRSAAAADHIFISHGHADHIGAIVSHLGIRALVGKRKPPTVYLPIEIDKPLREMLKITKELHGYDMDIITVPMEHGQRAKIRGDLEVRAFKTHHRVPSLGYSLVRTISKLRKEFVGLPGQEIAQRKRAGEDLFRIEERTELSYSTDTLVQVLDNNPELYKSRVLILECTFLDKKKSLAAARAGCHIHLDELIERADLFENAALVLMHFSQLYKPQEVREVLKSRCPTHLFDRIVPFLPKSKHWPG